jgi:hypothetical protein
MSPDYLRAKANRDLALNDFHGGEREDVRLSSSMSSHVQCLSCDGLSFVCLSVCLHVLKFERILLPK